jgi:hypothetical protein
MFAVGVAMLGLFTGCAGGSIEARANSRQSRPIGVLFRFELRESRCGPPSCSCFAMSIAIAGRRNAFSAPAAGMTGFEAFTKCRQSLHSVDLAGCRESVNVFVINNL